MFNVDIVPIEYKGLAGVLYCSSFGIGEILVFLLSLGLPQEPSLGNTGF